MGNGYIKVPRLTGTSGWTGAMKLENLQSVQDWACSLGNLLRQGCCLHVLVLWVLFTRLLFAKTVKLQMKGAHFCCFCLTRDVMATAVLFLGLEQVMLLNLWGVVVVTKDSYKFLFVCLSMRIFEIIGDITRI